MPHPPAPTRRGFTLIELSIVLVVLGLLVGGVLVGRSLIRQAQLRAVLSDVETIKTAISVFEGKYDELPGDMTAATRYWAATANGLGDGVITPSWDGTAVHYEDYLAWQHLGLAGLMRQQTNGSFGGRCGPVGCQWYSMDVDVNVPKARTGRREGFYLAWPSSGDMLYTPSLVTRPGHALVFGAEAGATAAQQRGPIFYPALTGSEAASMDAKLDDGRAGGGAFTAAFPPATTQAGSADVLNPACVTSGNPATAEYQTTSESRACAVMFWLDLR